MIDCLSNMDLSNPNVFEVNQKANGRISGGIEMSTERTSEIAKLVM